MSQPVRLVFVITDLDTGGAETMLLRLLARIDRSTFYPQVISLRNDGKIGEKIRQLDIPVWCLGMSPSFKGLLSVPRLVEKLKEFHPDLVVTWMYHADLVGGIAARLAGISRLIWNIHNSTLDPKFTRQSTYWTVILCSWLSRLLPSSIVSCSEKASQVHVQLGYDAKKMLVIPNGFDLELFHPDAAARADVRREIRIAEQDILVGLAARFDPQKDHRTFIQSAGMIANENPGVHFLLCGSGVDANNPQLAAWVGQTGAIERFHLLGLREDMPRLMASLDIAVLSSAYGEAFPVVIGEAMACEVPCIVTDIGDSAFLVGDCGIVVPPRNPLALANALGSMINMAAEKMSEMRKSARHRVESQFNIKPIVRTHQALYLKTIHHD